MDIAVVVNLKARRGSEKVARTCRRHLPDARVLASQTLDETLGFARDLRENPPKLLLSAGGDGTVVALMNALREKSTPQLDGVHPQLLGGAIGLLPLGTGNGWAHVTGAPRWRAGLSQLGQLVERGGPLPVRRFDLLEVEGRIAHFAGTGWDADIIDDFHAQKTGWGVLPPGARKGLAGYLQGLFTRTIPRHAREPQVEVELINTGEDAMTLDDRGRPMRLPGGGHGAVLYRGPSSVCGVGTTQEWGFGFKAFPFANTVARRFNLRLYSGKALEATLQMKSLWAGKHPMDKMHTWLLSACKVRFSRAVPFQIGGDRVGHRQEVDYALAAERVDVLDWRAMS